MASSHLTVDHFGVWTTNPPIEPRIGPRWLGEADKFDD
jgi:hypothetical protein